MRGVMQVCREKGPNKWVAEGLRKAKKLTGGGKLDGMQGKERDEGM